MDAEVRTESVETGISSLGFRKPSIGKVARIIDPKKLGALKRKRPAILLAHRPFRFREGRPAAHRACHCEGGAQGSAQNQSE